MSVEDLDEVDRGILYLLQQDARNLTPVDMADRLPVSEGTVRNRIEKMEERGVIRGYVPTIDYEAAGFPLEVVFTCTVAADRLAAVSEELLDIHGVVNVRELLAGQGNLEVTGIATDLADVMAIAAELTELDVTIESQRLTIDEHVQPFNHLGQHVAED